MGGCEPRVGVRGEVREREIVWLRARARVCVYV